MFGVLFGVVWCWVCCLFVKHDVFFLARFLWDWPRFYRDRDFIKSPCCLGCGFVYLWFCVFVVLCCFMLFCVIRGFFLLDPLNPEMNFVKNMNP